MLKASEERANCVEDELASNARTYVDLLADVSLGPYYCDDEFYL